MHHRYSLRPRNPKPRVMCDRSFFLVVLGGVAAGCGGDPEPLARPSCVFEESELGFDEQSPLGFSAAILVPKLGTRECSWQWNDPAKVGSLYPEPSQVAAQISLTYSGGAVRFLEGKLINPSPGFRTFCGSKLFAESTLAIKTADMAISIAMPVDVEILGSGWAFVEADVSKTDLGADYEFDWAETWPTSGRALQNRLDPGGRAFGTLVEHAQELPVTTGGVTTTEGVVFRAADWSCGAATSP